MKTFFLFLSFSFFSAATSAADCTQLIGTCDYYLCRDNIHSCNYYENFAYKYCKKSEDNLSLKMSPQGKKWIKKVAICLQESVERIPVNESCGSVYRLAVADHSECYDQADFCSLPKKEKLHIFIMLKKEIYHRKIFIEGLEILRQCIFKN